MSADLSDPVYKEIVTARVRLLFQRPFFGQQACRLTLVDASKWCKTAATDGRYLYYNREFIKGLNKEELLFLIGHEILHCIYDHLGRRGARDPKIWNMANDYIVNWTLVDQNLGKMPKEGLYKVEYNDEHTSEELYEKLKKDSTTIKMTLDEHLDLGSDQSDDGDGKDGSQPGDKLGNGKGKGKTFEVTVMGEDGPPTLSEDDLQKIRNEIRSSVIQSVQQLGAGHVPAGVLRLVHQLVEPKMDWRTLLDATIRSCVKDDYTFNRLSRRTWAMNGMVLPAQEYLNTIDIAVTIDASGSMSEEMLRDILSETKGIMTTFRDFKLRLWTFDTSVYSYKEFTPENIDDIDTYPLKGGGGTLFECNWEFMKREGIEPQRFIMFTDGYPGGSWGDEEYCDTLFVIHGNTKIVAPFGMTAYYEAKNS